MPTSRDTGHNELAPVSYLPGVREAGAHRAENVTMHALTRRGQSRAEVADLLRRREVDPLVAEAELDRLESVGLIDDRALALELVERLRTRKKLGASALRNELMRRKLDRDAIDEALSVSDDGDDDDLVVQLAIDRARRLGSLDRSTAERRLVDFLARKGHTGSSARDAARRALDGEPFGADAGTDANADASADDHDSRGASGRFGDGASSGGRVHRVEFR